jgi:hypothetical protein
MVEGSTTLYKKQIFRKHAVVSATETKIIPTLNLDVQYTYDNIT